MQTKELSDSPAFIDVTVRTDIGDLNRRAVSACCLSPQDLCVRGNLLFVGSIAQRLRKHPAVQRLAATNAFQSQDSRRDIDVPGGGSNRNSALKVGAPKYQGVTHDPRAHT